MCRALLFLSAALLCAACSDTPPAHAAQNRDLPATLMRQMIGPAKPCIERFTGRVPDPYLAEVRLERRPDSTIALSFVRGDQADFNACVVEAVASARVPAGALQEPILVPFAFAFAAP